MGPISGNCELRGQRIRKSWINAVAPQQSIYWMPTSARKFLPPLRTARKYFFIVAETLVYLRP